MNRYQFDDTTKKTLEKLRVPLAVFQLINKKAVTILLSDSFCETLGINDRKEAMFMMDHNMFDMVHPDERARVHDEAVSFSYVGGKFDTVYRIRFRNGNEYKIVHAVGEHVQTEDGVRLAYVWFTDEGLYSDENDIRHVSVDRALKRSLYDASVVNAANYDVLTGLPSMYRFFELADQWRNNLIGSDSRAYLIYMNLSGMKYYNRRHGFAEGDKLLRRFAEILIMHFGNDHCSRLGSDHFGVYTDLSNIEDVLREIFKEFRFDKTGESLPIRVGIYIDEYKEISVSTECDRAKYACDTMRNTQISGFRYFDNNMLVQMEKREYYIDNLNKAIRDKWIQVFYQPIVRSANGRVCDEEALARWIDPVKGIISPSEFVPVLEEAKLIYKLDLYVVEQVLKKIRIQEREGLHIVPISINLSRSDFDSCDIVDEIRSRVDASGVSRNRINIEVTESTVGKDLEYMKVQIERFRNMGFNVWMDDFGSGYSSLDMLHSIPFDLIKFDMRFMTQFSDSSRSRIMLTELIRMAISLDIDTVCEGVETMEQVDFLREVGCTMMQGYYFCRPIPMDKILDRYRKGIQIGFENPEESEYYAAIGKVNLYDLAIITNDDSEAFAHYFNTIPMAIIESNADNFTLVRCNSTYRAFLIKMLGHLPLGKSVNFAKGDGVTSKGFLKTLKKCAQKGGKVLVDEKLPDGTYMNAFLKCIAVNPVNNTRATVVAVLAITSDEKGSVALSNMSKALVSDYFSMYHVDLLTDKYVVYNTDIDLGELAVERSGDNFFEEGYLEACKYMYREDTEKFIKKFTKDNVLQSLKRDGSFKMSFRQKINGELSLVSMKAVPSKMDEHHIIIGFAQENKAPKTAFDALSGDFGGDE